MSVPARRLTRWLRSEGHDAFSVFEQARGISDDAVISRAYNENRILITNDKDFGELTYRNKKPHCGIILLRLSDESSQKKIGIVSQLLKLYADKLPNAFVVVTEDQVLFAHEHQSRD